MNHNILFGFKLSVIYLNGYPIPHIVVIRQRIGERAVKAYLKVQMIAERIAGISDRSYRLSLRYGLADTYIQL